MIIIVLIIYNIGLCLSFSCGKSSPLRVPVLRIENETKSISQEITPSRAQYLESLCRLRDLSLARNLPSAFVLVLKALKAKVNFKSWLYCCIQFYFCCLVSLVIFNLFHGTSPLVFKNISWPQLFLTCILLGPINNCFFFYP